MIFLYRILTYLSYPILILIIFFRKIKNKEDNERYKEKIFVPSFNPKKDKNLKLIWFHAASIGELKSIIPIIRNLKKENKKLQFLVTTITLSSANLAKDIFANETSIFHRFFPLDIEFLQNNFLNMWRPDAIFLVDSEIWPNMILKAKKMNIPLAIINARITRRSFKRWMLIPKTAKKIFSSFDLCLTSNLETKEFLQRLNVSKVLYSGNIKLINTKDNKKTLFNNKDVLINNKFWCAISTHKNEEEFCLKVHQLIKKKYKTIKTIIAPRHIERSHEIKKICDNKNLSCQILNKNDLILSSKEIIIINSFGILSNFFNYSRSVFMGKSLIKKFERNGGQNPIEAAKLGCKIYHGPYVYNFKEIYEIFEKYDISKKIDTVEKLADNLIIDFGENKDISKNLSIKLDILSDEILEKTMKNINKFLLNDTK